MRARTAILTNDATRPLVPIELGLPERLLETDSRLFEIRISNNRDYTEADVNWLAEKWSLKYKHMDGPQYAI